MVLLKAKALINRLLDRGLSPVITKLGENEYTISVLIPTSEASTITPEDLQDVIDLGIGVQVDSVKFT